MKILLLGRTGQLGWELQRSLAPIGELVALGRDAAGNLDGLCGDLEDVDGLATTAHVLRPDVIVNAAAYTAVDKAESEPSLAHAINAQAPAALAQAADAAGAWLVHYSSEHVFDGGGHRPWCETDAPAPLNAYGQSKRDGDQAVARCARHLILRTSWVMGARGDNFVKAILQRALDGSALRVVDDQIGAPTSAELLADVTAHALRSVMKAPALAGTYHCAAAGEVSWHGYARFVLEQAAAQGWPLVTGPAQLQAISSSDHPMAARRPLNARLATGKLRAAFGLHLPDWQMGVARMLQELPPPHSA